MIWMIKKRGSKNLATKTKHQENCRTIFQNLKISSLSGGVPPSRGGPPQENWSCNRCSRGNVLACPIDRSPRGFGAPTSLTLVYNDRRCSLKFLLLISFVRSSYTDLKEATVFCCCCLLLSVFEHIFHALKNPDSNGDFDEKCAQNKGALKNRKSRIPPARRLRKNRYQPRFTSDSSPILGG